MDWKEAGRYWDDNAPAWTEMARAGFDVCRNYLNTPAFLAMLPAVKNLQGLDVGCGEGYNTRLVAELGAKMRAIDVSEKFIEYARAGERETPLGIEYQLASATELPFADESFDFVMATMSLMDVPELDEAIGEIHRVLKTGGFLQFSICHPCFQTPRMQWVEKEGERDGLICGDYFHPPEQGVIQKWTFSHAPEELRDKHADFQVPTFFYTLSHWLNSLINCGFILESFNEPYPDDQVIERFPGLACLRKVALFLHVRCRKK